MASAVRALLFQPASDSLAAAVLGAPANASNMSFVNSSFGNPSIGNSSLQALANASNVSFDNSSASRSSSFGNSSLVNSSPKGLLEALANTSNSSAGKSSSLLGNSSFGNSSRDPAAPSSSTSSSSNHEDAHASCLLWEGEGCSAIHDRETCLGKRDGRPWAYWDGFVVAGQPCAWCGGEKCLEGSDSRCMPYAWVENRTGLSVANCSTNETVQIVSKMLSAIWESPLAANSSVHFEPALGDRRCAARGMDDSGLFNKFYWTFTAVSHHQCQGICASKSYCKGFQFESERRECQIWWHPIDSMQAAPLGFGRNFSCVRVAAEGAEGGSARLGPDLSTVTDTTTTITATAIAATAVPPEQEGENLSEELFGSNSTARANLTDTQQIATTSELMNLSEHALQEQSLDGDAAAEANLTDRRRAAAARQALSADALQEQSSDSNAAADQEGLTGQQKAAIGGAVGGVAGAALLGGLLGGLLPGALATHTATATATATLTTTTVWMAEALVRNLSDDGDNLSDENASDGSLLPASTRVLTRGSDGLQDLMGGGGLPRWPSWALPGLLLAALLAVALAFACGFAHRTSRSAEIDESDSSDMESQANFFEYSAKVAPPAPPSRPLGGVGRPPSARALQATRPPAVAVRRSLPAARQTASSSWRPMLARVFRDMPAGGARSSSPVPSAQRQEPLTSSPLLASPVSLRRLRARSPMRSASPLQHWPSTQTIPPLWLSAGDSTVCLPMRISVGSSTTPMSTRRRAASPLRQASPLLHTSPLGSPLRLSMDSPAAVAPPLRLVSVGAPGRLASDMSPVTTQAGTPVGSQVLYDVVTQLNTPVSSQTMPVVGSQSTQLVWQAGPATARLAEPMVPAPLSARRNMYSQ